MTVLDAIKDDVQTFHELFRKCLLRDAKNHNFTELMFLIDEITGENADDYIYAVINALDKPTIIKIESNRAGFKPLSDVTLITFLDDIA